MSGGTLRVLGGSVISAFEPLLTHGFWIDSGAAAEFRDSTFIACGIHYCEVDQQIIGGIVSHSDSLTISNCSFIGAHIGLTLYEGTTVDSSRFIANYVGAENLAAPVEFRDCSFERNTMAGPTSHRPITPTAAS